MQAGHPFPPFACFPIADRDAKASFLPSFWSASSPLSACGPSPFSSRMRQSTHPNRKQTPGKQLHSNAQILLQACDRATIGIRHGPDARNIGPGLPDRLQYMSTFSRSLPDSESSRKAKTEQFSSQNAQDADITPSTSTVILLISERRGSPPSSFALLSP